MTHHVEEAPRSLPRTLAAFRHGTHDRTTRLTDTTFLRATHTPDGPATLRIAWSDPYGTYDADAWGPGASWMLPRAPHMAGDHDRHVRIDDADPVVAKALRAQRTRRIGASADIYHEIVPVILAQRITAGEAIKQWYALCDALSEPAPGPPDLVDGLRLPPAPDTLARRPAYWFHPLGIEQKRATALSEVGIHAAKFWDWAEDGPPTVRARLPLMRQVGEWTLTSVLGPAVGDPDAAVVGDFHFPNIIAHAMAGEARADDDRMLELLEPYRGQRGRVQHAVLSTAGKAPSFGPRRRIMPIARW